MAKKMNTQRNDGRYMVKVYIGIKDGKKTYKYVYGKTQKEADRKAEELKVLLRILYTKLIFFSYFILLYSIITLLQEILFQILSRQSRVRLHQSYT